MRHWSIARRLRFAIGAAAGLVLALSAGVVLSVFLLGAGFHEYQGSSGLSAQATRIAEAVHEAQIAAHVWRATGADSEAEEFRRSIEEIAAVRAALQADGAVAGLGGKLDGIGATTDRFLADFERIVALAPEIATRRAAIDEAGAAARETVATLMDAANRAGDAAQTFSAARVQEALLRGRLHGERFLLSASGQELDHARERLAHAVQQLSWMGTMAGDRARADLIEVARGQIDGLGAELDAAQEALAARDALDAKMHADAAEMLALTDALLEGAAARQSEATALVERTIAATQTAVIAAGVAALALALLFGRALIRQITHEVEGTLATVSALAGGDLEVEIAGAERDTEMGRIAQALVTFRDNGRKAAELAREAKETEARAAEEARQREAQEREAEARRARAEQEAAERHKAEIFRKLEAAVSGVVAAAAGGDFSRRVDAAALDPELAGLAEEINRLMANVDASLGEISRVTARLAEGDLRDGMAGRFSGTFAELQDNIETMIAALGEIVAEISNEAEGVAGQAGEMTSSAEDLATRAEAQAASLEQTSAAMTQIASSAESNAQSAAETDSAATAMSSEAGEARRVLDGTVAAMRDIEEHSKEIEAIVDVIEDIAFQTNLLSLNASVEAARAGEAGKGFAVVANEVRALAQRSAEASSKVQQIISQSTGAIGRGSEAVGATGDAISRIVDRIDAVSGNLREIKSASEEQATAVKDISNAFAELDKITQKNAAVAEETRGAAALLSAQSDRMRKTVGTVRLRERAIGPSRSAAA